MTVAVVAPMPCVCDACGAKAEIDAVVFLRVAIRPPPGWFVHIVDRRTLALFCTEACARRGIDGADAIVDIADQLNIQAKEKPTPA
jgi:hypothetical protein